MSRSLCHVNDDLVARGLRKPGCINCVANDDPNDPCYIINHKVNSIDPYKTNYLTCRICGINPPSNNGICPMCSYKGYDKYENIKTDI
jgi:hypothetical protein